MDTKRLYQLKPEYASKAHPDYRLIDYQGPGMYMLSRGLWGKTNSIEAPIHEVAKLVFAGSMLPLGHNVLEPEARPVYRVSGPLWKQCPEHGWQEDINNNCRLCLEADYHDWARSKPCGIQDHAAEERASFIEEYERARELYEREFEGSGLVVEPGMIWSFCPSCSTRSNHLDGHQFACGQCDTEFPNPAVDKIGQPLIVTDYGEEPEADEEPEDYEFDLVYWHTRQTRSSGLTSLIHATGDDWQTTLCGIKNEVAQWLPVYNSTLPNCKRCLAKLGK